MKHELSTAKQSPVVLSVNQDAGIGPTRAKGAAVHLNAMRKAFTTLGADCRGIDEPDDTRLTQTLQAALDEGPVDLIYERYALGKSTSSQFAKSHQIPLVLEVNSPLADEQRRWRGETNEADDARHDAFAMDAACRIVAVSSDVARYAVERGADVNRVEVLANGIDVDYFNLSARNRSFRESLIPAERFVIGFHGRLRPWHGFEMLTNIVASLLTRGREVHLLVVGEGDFESLSCLPQDRYTHIKWQPHHKMPAYVSVFDVLPLTYHADMPCYFSPLKLKEAMACGVVPLVPDLGDLTDAVKHRETGLVYKAGNEQQLLEQLESLIADKDLLEYMGGQAAIEASQNSWEHIAASVLEFAAGKHRSNLPNH